MSSPQHIGSAAPFSTAVEEYRLKGWNVIPLPHRKKKSPPGKDDGPQYESFTGRNGRMVEDSDVEIWTAKDSEWAKGNIALRPGNEVQYDGRTMEVIGIDVDAYKQKNGKSHLAELETTHGPLPNTWTSSARRDSVSGIRWYLVPFGYEYMGKPRLRNGKASDSIEIVQRVHRYGVVFPSYNPDAKAQYCWYSTGQAPDGIHVSPAIPRPEQMAELPESWFLFLTRQGTESTGTVPIDMDTPTQELYRWATRHFASNREKPCRTTRVALKNHREKIDNATDHHDPLVNAHWNLFNLGAEGHSHWFEAVKLAEKSWLAKVESDRARSLPEAKSEITRSREGVLRKIKGKDDEYKALGLVYLVDSDPCGRDGHAPPPIIQPTMPTATAAGAPQYERNEDGNAQQFLDMFGDRIRYVPNHADGMGRWLIFLQEEKRWMVDTKDSLIRNLYRQVKTQQMRDAELRMAQVNAQAAAAGTPLPPALAQAKAEAKAWVQWALESGNKTRVSNSLAMAQSYPGVSVLYEELDADDMLLPVANGVIRFATREQRLAGANAYTVHRDPEEVKELMLTQNTHVPYIPYGDQATHEDPKVRENFEKFESYLRTFLRDHMEPASFQYALRLLGLSILGVNAKKAIFLVGERDTGKSTFQSMMDAALGDLSIWREPRIFEDSNFKSSLAEALSRRVAMVGELGERHMDASLFKRITGGDQVSCQMKNINKPVTLRARCTIISGCNSAPYVPHADDATKERFVVIPFRHQVSRAEKDPNAQQDLMDSCRVPLLALLIESCEQAIMEGVQVVPGELQMEATEFVSGLNELSDFINEVLVQSTPDEWESYARKDVALDLSNPLPRWPDELCVGDTDLWNAYKHYESANQMPKLSKRDLTTKLKAAGLVRDGSYTSTNQRRWIGVTLRRSARLHTADNTAL